MNPLNSRSSVAQVALTLFATACVPLLLSPALAHDDGHGNSGKQHSVYDNRVLVSDGSVAADNTDPNLVNAWGVAFNPTAFVWVNAADSGKAVLYDGTGKPQPLVVTIPGPNGAMGNPTGIVFSGGMDFVVTDGTTNGPARFIFATENGTIAGWAPNVNTANAFTAVDNSDAAASYKGLAIGGDGKTHLLYAADFHNARIDVFDSAFKQVEVPGGFVDPDLPKGYAPFGIQAVNGDIYVTYGKQDEEAEEEVKGPGLGVVNIFDAEGNFVRRLATRGALNAPWGIALAPESYGEFGGTILIGNFGDGAINAYGPRSGKFLGALRDAKGQPIHIDGLWGLAFGNGVEQQKSNALFYAAGPNDESGGAYGVLTVEK